jgi:hypothetical protein
MERVLKELGLEEGAGLVEAVLALLDYGVPLALLREGEEAVLAYMRRYGPLERVSQEAMEDFLKRTPGDKRVRAALLHLAQEGDVLLPRGMWAELEARLDKPPPAG